jgi:metal-dependent HD superfamily phosphatase/phosphodiesterase
LSALAIKKVEIDSSEKNPVSIRVHMDNPAGVFQMEEVLGKKIKSSNLGQFVEVLAIQNGNMIKIL